MRALVTGGAGFLGRHLLGSFARLGDVRSLDVVGPPPGGWEVNIGDVRDPTSVDQAVAGCEVVVHSAAMVPMSRAGSRFWDVNVEGTRNVLDRSLRAGVRKVLVISSSAVYGRPLELPVTEATPLNPFDAYGRSKVGAERLCIDFRAKGLDVSILRPRTIIGKGRLGIVEFLFDRVRRGRSVFILGRGKNRYQLVSALDFVDGCVLAATKPCENEDFNLGAERFATLREDLGSLIDYAGTKAKVRGIPAPPGRLLLGVQDSLRLGPFVPYQYVMVTQDMWFDISKAKSILGWAPKEGNGDMLKATYDWFIDHAPSEGGSAHTRRSKSPLASLLRRL